MNVTIALLAIYAKLKKKIKPKYFFFLIFQQVRIFSSFINSCAWQNTPKVLILVTNLDEVQGS